MTQVAVMMREIEELQGQNQQDGDVEEEEEDDEDAEIAAGNARLRHGVLHGVG